MTEKKVTKKKAATRKKAEKSVFEMLQDSVIGQPFVIADKIFLASLGLFSTIQTEFSNKFDELVKDGEVARDRYQATFSKFQDDVTRKVTGTKARVTESVKPAAAE